MPQDALPNGSALDQAPGPWSQVAGMQAKLHRWAAADPGRRFDDLFNFVHDPATLYVAYCRVEGNRGANTPSVDGMTVRLVEERIGVQEFLDDLRAQLKAGTFRPGFEPVSYGFRPVRRAHDAIAEIHQFGAFRVVLAVAEVVIQLAFQGALDDYLGQPAEQPALAGQPQPARPGPLGKLGQQLLISRRQLRFGLAGSLSRQSSGVSSVSGVTPLKMTVPCHRFSLLRRLRGRGR
jgi:hypothetical protein